MYTPVTISWCWSAFKLPSLSPEGANRKTLKPPHKNCDWCLPGCMKKSEKDRLSNGPTLHVCVGKEMTCTMIHPNVWKIVFWRQDSTVWWLVLALQRDWQWGFDLPSRWLSHPPSCESLLHAIGSSFTGTWKKYRTMACSIAMLVLFTRRVCRIMLLSLFKFHLSILDQPLILYFHIGTLLVEHSSQVATCPESLW